MTDFLAIFFNKHLNTQINADPNKVVHTELTLAPQEFDSYRVTQDAEITFCLKEFRVAAVNVLVRSLSMCRYVSIYMCMYLYDMICTSNPL